MLTQNDTCVVVKDCQAAIAHIKNIRVDPNSRMYLKQAHCGFLGNIPLVKCAAIPELPKSEGCIPLKNCQNALKSIHNNVFNPLFVEKLRSATCGNPSEQPMIQCSMFR